MAKKLLCVVLSITMLLGAFAVSSFAGNYYDYTPETAAEEIAEKYWYVDYDADVDWKDEIDRRWLTGTKMYDGSADEAAPQEILEYNLYFWADEIIADYNNATSNEDYWNLYNKMATPELAEFTYEEDGEMITECDILYDFAYFYREESKATFDLDIQANAAYAKAGDTITVEVYATSNFLTSIVTGGIFYNKQYLTPVSVVFCETSDPTWIQKEVQLDQAVKYDADGNITFDRRADYWPEDMQTEENFAKYGVSWIYARGNDSLGLGNFNHGRQFDNELLFTATYEVKADVPEGAELEFFVCDSVFKVSELGYAEHGNGEDAACWTLYRVDYPGHTLATQDLMADYNSFGEQTVTSNTEIVTIGEEPTVEPEPAVKGDIVDVYTGVAYVGDTTAIDVEVTGAPEALRLVTADGYQIFTRDDATIVAFGENELWTIEVYVSEQYTEYTVYADYGELGATDGKTFYINAEVKADTGIHSIEVPDMYGGMGGMILAGKHDVIIKTSTDVTKVQFYAEDGTTYTYTSMEGYPGYMPYEDIDGERVWTISHSFGPYGYRSLVIRTRTADTLFAATNTTLDATVVY